MQTMSHLAAKVQKGEHRWVHAMGQAEHDADRLCMIALSSRIRVGITQYMDDTKLQASGWGGLVAAAAVATATAGKTGG